MLAQVMLSRDRGRAKLKSYKNLIQNLTKNSFSSGSRWAVVSPLDSVPASCLSSLKQAWRCHTSGRSFSLRDDCKPPSCLIAIYLRKDFSAFNVPSLAVFTFSLSVVCQAIGYRWAVGMLQGRARLACAQPCRRQTERSSANDRWAARCQIFEIDF